MISINSLITSIYRSQQELSIVIYSQIYYRHNYIIIFLGGVLSSFSPCFISVIPVIFSYMNNKEKNSHPLGLVAGLLTSTTLILTAITLLHKYYNYFIHYTPYITSIGKILIGLNLLQIIYFPSINITQPTFKSVQLEIEINNYIVGLVAGLNSLSCNTSITFTLGAIINSINNFIVSILCILIYVLGYISPIIILININSLYIKFITINITWNTIVYISGCFVLGSGIFNLLENLLR